MLRIVHLCAASLSMMLVASFWLGSELTRWYAPGFHANARLAILCAIPLLVVSIATAGITGRRLAGARTDALPRMKRALVVLVAVNGGLVLAPCAVWLRGGVTEGPVADVEGIAGAVQLIALLALAGAGRALRARRQRRRQHPDRVHRVDAPPPAPTGRDHLAQHS